MTQQSKYKGWAIPAIGAAAVLSLGLFAAGCGGGGGGTTAGATTSSVSGAAVKGPIANGTVDVYANGSFVGRTTTNNYGEYTFSTTSTLTPPVDIYIYGGTDTVTGNVPDFPLQATLSSTTGNISSATINTNALTTMIAKTAKALSTGGKPSKTDLDNARNKIMSTLGFGLDSTIDPTTTKLTTSNTVQILKAAEAAGEFIRRTKANSGATNISDVIQAIAEDATDGAIDGKVLSTITQTQAALATKVASQAALSQAEVLSEIVQNKLKITDGAGATVVANATSKLDALVSKITTGAVGTMSSVAVTNSLKNQFTAVAAKVKALTGNSVDYTAFATAVTSGTTLPTPPATATTTQISNLNAVTLSNLNNATKAANVAASFTNNLSLTVQDYNASAVAITPAQTVTGTLASGVLTANFATALNATNLSNVVTNATTGVSPYVTLNLTNTPYAAGTTTVTAILKDGTTATRGTGERYIKVVFGVDYSSNGSTLTLTAAKGTATATYYTAAATTAATATLTNAAANTLSTGSSVNNQGAQMKAAFANLFSQVTALSAVQVTGSYFYSLSFSGFPMADASGNAITSVQGTFSVQ